MAIAKRGKGYCARHKQVVPRGCACAECIIEFAGIYRRAYRLKPYRCHPCCGTPYPGPHTKRCKGLGALRAAER